MSVLLGQQKAEQEGQDTSTAGGTVGNSTGTEIQPRCLYCWGTRKLYRDRTLVQMSVPLDCMKLVRDRTPVQMSAPVGQHEKEQGQDTCPDVCFSSAA